MMLRYIQSHAFSNYIMILWSTADPSAITNVLSVALPSVTPFIITSVASGSQQTLSTPLPQFSITPMVCSKQAMSTPLPQLNITRRQATSAPLPQLSLTPKQKVSATLPQLNNTPISKVPCLQQRNILQELNSNICYNPATKTKVLLLVLLILVLLSSLFFSGDSFSLWWRLNHGLSPGEEIGALMKQCGCLIVARYKKILFLSAQYHSNESAGLLHLL